MKAYFVYITTNPAKTVLYIGVTNDLSRRIYEHREDRNNKQTFTGRYYCYNLIYYEAYETADEAINREKEIKTWRREKKNELISSVNPKWNRILPPE